MEDRQSASLGNGVKVTLVRAIPNANVAIRLASVLSAIALASVLCACGGGDRAANSAQHTSSVAALLSSGPVKYVSHTAPPPGSPYARYLNDADNDPIGDEDPDNRRDDDNDASWDYQPETNENKEFRDGDDASVVVFGHAASGSELQVFTAMVKRYYAAAARGDARTVCPMILPSLIVAMPLDEGRWGPAYLHGAKTCQTVMTRIFKHFHHELSAPVAVTAVRVDGVRALVFLGSTTMPASYVPLLRERGAWVVEGLTANRLP
ncbi:MAG TPA: hypothetical protein VGY30_12455 [Solirubrobacteraceae bacterium]|jgi:hypothetical protein|nr:hypothetical protein [Solirubrobacteraceae bacterium]